MYSKLLLLIFTICLLVFPEVDAYQSRKLLNAQSRAAKGARAREKENQSKFPPMGYPGMGPPLFHGGGGNGGGGSSGGGNEVGGGNGGGGNGGGGNGGGGNGGGDNGQNAQKATLVRWMMNGK
ncbi:hypothetical protein CYMTET_40853 [Cymbomonas tetramitiformis]|uniref:Glycine-rich protein n=1 Tax=Cymbomonas tetramitiformis TaxID=36881 RepID=A0AAE0C798_9CHLO|nr:hypothetical protein CYMTET_40853 [Cymbomonas tetramitiformis]